MSSMSAHIVSKNRAWIVFNPAGRQVGEFPIQREAIDTAKGLFKSARAGQVVVHGNNGSYRIAFRKGLPELQRRRDRSSLGRETIKKAISSVVRSRLLGA